MGGAEMRQLWREWQESQDDDAEHDSADSASGDDEGNDTTLPYPRGPRTLQFARASARAPTHTRAHTLAALSGGVMSDGARGGMESGSRMRLQGH